MSYWIKTCRTNFSTIKKEFGKFAMKILQKSELSVVTGWAEIKTLLSQSNDAPDPENTGWSVSVKTEPEYIN